ncbi:MAG TPA: hypothetical protein VHX88_15425 [Solirubrobacteraceae bacterium]|jgi:hypothetical protein|nr:hypothetical protein [Solirubrobacteraceae bacterium]
MNGLAAALIGVAVVVGSAGGWAVAALRRRHALGTARAARRIAFPFTAEALAEPALGAALRIARAEGSTLLPVYLAIVPRSLPLECALPAEASTAFAVLEAIEHRAALAEVPVDARIERGRTVRHALAQLMANERCERMVVAAAGERDGAGLHPDDIAWLLERSTAEVVAVRPARDPSGGPVMAGRTLRRPWRTNGRRRAARVRA